MSSPLAIAGVTAAIKDLLNDGLLNQDLSAVGSFTVTSLPPDRIATGETEPNQLNVFLYQVTPNLGWRNVGLPSRDGGGARLTNAPLALDLHYLITAYGAEDLTAEILLGYAMQVLHETPVLTRDALRVVLGAGSPVDGSVLPAPFNNLPSVDLADQVELIKISPVFLGTEDLSKLWTAMQARYRPTMAYMASVVLIQGTAPAKAALPVLKRGPDDRGPVALAGSFAVLSEVKVAASDLLPAMRLGDELRLAGSGFNAPGPIVVLFENAVSGSLVELAPTSSTETEIRVKLPDFDDNAGVISEWKPGLYRVSVRVSRPGTPDYVTNSVPVALAPLIVISPLSAASGDIELTVTAVPRLAAEQGSQTELAFGSRTVPPESVDTPADTTQPTTATFKLTGVVAGTYITRLRIAGIESLPVTYSGSPARFEFDPGQRVVVQ